MSDFDTRRVGEIATLEEKLQNATQRGAAYQVIAERWQPRVASVIADDEAKISLTFGGKTMSIRVPVTSLQGADTTSASTEFLKAMFDALILDSMRPIVQPEMQRMIDAANSLKAVSKW